MPDIALTMAYSAFPEGIHLRLDFVQRPVDFIDGADARFDAVVFDAVQGLRAALASIHTSHPTNRAVLTLNRAASLRTWSSVKARSPLRIMDAADSVRPGGCRARGPLFGARQRTRARLRAVCALPCRQCVGSSRKRQSAHRAYRGSASGLR